tara:strand:+ start:108 stop:395 length:288 start_codon:yes stop_codon:yes gene_type:complete
MIKQELNILQEQGYMDMTEKKQVIEAALLDCQNSLQESYDLVKATMPQDSNDTSKYKQVLNNITISLTILKLMQTMGYGEAKKAVKILTSFKEES